MSNMYDENGAKAENDCQKNEVCFETNSGVVRMYGVASGAVIAMASLGYANKSNNTQKSVVKPLNSGFCDKVKQFVKNNQKLINLFSWIL